MRMYIVNGVSFNQDAGPQAREFFHNSNYLGSYFRVETSQDGVQWKFLYQETRV